MTLFNLVNTITDIAKAQPNMGSVFVGDVYELNHRQDVQYPAFVLTQQQHRKNPNTEITTYNLNLFVVDRLTDDKENRLDVQSHSIKNLENIVGGLYDLPVTIINDFTINTFEERFNDVCAGAYISLNCQIQESDCDFDTFIEFIPTSKLTDLYVTENGTYTAEYGYKTVEVDVAGPEYEQIDAVLTSQNPELHELGSFDKVDVVVEGDKLEKELTPRATSFKDNTKIYTDVDVKIKTQPTLKMRRNNETLSMKMAGAFPETLEIDVPTQEITLTENGTWESPKDYNYAHKVTVNVPDPPTVSSKTVAHIRELILIQMLLI